MHRIIVRMLQIITFTTLLSDLRAVNPVELSQTTFYPHESNNSIRTEVYAVYFRNPLLTCGIVLLVLWIIFQTCYFGRCESDTDKDRNIASYVCYLLLYACKLHVNLRVWQRLFKRHRRACADKIYKNHSVYEV